MIDSAPNRKSTSGLNPGETPQQFLENAFCELPHIEGVFLFTPEGEVLAQTTDSTVNAASFSALVGSLLQSAQFLVGELERGKLNYVALQCQRGPLVAARLDSGHTLVLLGHHDIRLGLVLYDLESLATRLIPALS